MKLPSITLTTSRTLQVLTGLLDLANIIAPQVPADYKDVFAAVLVLLHFGINELAHRSMPDGRAIAPEAK